MESAYYIIENHLPVYTWPMLLLIFLVSLGPCIWIGMRQGRFIGNGSRWGRPVLTSLLVTYTAAILFTTLVFRTSTSSHKAEWFPLWSWYEVLFHHNMDLFEEILLNVSLFVPVGAMVALLYETRPKTAFLIGFAFSAAIETMQFITCRGLFEWDDMLHNGLGCMIGCYVGGRLHSLRNAKRGMNEKRQI